MSWENIDNKYHKKLILKFNDNIKHWCLFDKNNESVYFSMNDYVFKPELLMEIIDDYFINIRNEKINQIL